MPNGKCLLSLTSFLASSASRSSLSVVRNALATFFTSSNSQDSIFAREHFARPDPLTESRPAQKTRSAQAQRPPKIKKSLAAKRERVPINDQAQAGRAG